MRELSLNGYIDDESWFGDEITPESLHDLLYGTEDTLPEDVHIRLNSYGGSCKPSSPAMAPANRWAFWQRPAAHRPA